MTKSPTFNTLSGSLQSSITQINENFAEVTTAFNNTLSLDGSTPNAMNADFDMNNRDILNAGTVDTRVLTLNGSNYTTLSGALTTTYDYLGPNVVNILDYAGANGNGSHDNSSIFAQALSEAEGVYFPAGVWAMNNSTSFLLKTNHCIFGPGSFSTGPAAGQTGSAKLLFTGSATDCFQNNNPAAILQNVCFNGLSMYVTGSYTWLFDLNGMVGCQFSFLDIEATGLSTGLMRTAKVSGYPSWVNDFFWCRFRLPDGWDVSSTGASVSTARTMDADFGDGTISHCSFTGGLGPVFRGTGGLKILGSRFDRAVAGMRFQLETVSGAQHIVAHNQVEVNSTYDILVDGDAGFDPPVVGLSITGNTFRSNVVSSSIYLKRTSGVKLSDVTIDDNIFTAATTVQAIQIDENYWENISRGTGNTFYNKDYGYLRLGRPSLAGNELTIASGTILTTSSTHSVDTEGNAASDDLTSITGMLEGEVVLLRPNNSSRTVVVKNTPGAIELLGGDFQMHDTSHMICLVCTAPGVVAELFRTGYTGVAFDPVVTFSTPGDLLVSYAEQNGRWSIVGNVLHWVVNLEFTPTYTTASGDFTITGLPFSPSLNETTSSLSRFGNFVFGGSDLQIGGYVTTSGQIRIWRTVSGAAGGNATTTNVPSGSTYLLWISGSYLLD